MFSIIIKSLIWKASLGTCLDQLDHLRSSVFNMFKIFSVNTFFKNHFTLLNKTPAITLTSMIVAFHNCFSCLHCCKTTAQLNSVPTCRMGKRKGGLQLWQEKVHRTSHHMADASQMNSYDFSFHLWIYGRPRQWHIPIPRFQKCINSQPYPINLALTI